MGLIDANLSGHHVTETRLTIPAWGASYHDVSLDSEVTLTGSATLTVADLSIACTVLSGGPSNGRSFYRLVAGAGGWGKTVPSKSYANDAGVRLSTVLSDAASAVGETLVVGTDGQVGPAFVRPEGPAGRVLELLAPGAWYVGEDGKTYLGARPAVTLANEASVTSFVDLARGTVTIASDSIAKVLPGLTIAGLTAVDVEHTISAEGGLRSKIWGQQGAGTSRLNAAWKALFAQLDPDRAFRAVYEYRVVTLTGNRLNLQPVLVSTGMPTLQRVPIWPGVGGAKISPALGSSVIVAFINGDPSRPAVVGFIDADSSGFVPTSVSLGGGTSPVARVNDTVVIYFPSPMAFNGTIGGSPASGNLTATSPGYGQIQTGTPKVTA